MRTLHSRFCKKGRIFTLSHDHPIDDGLAPLFFFFVVETIIEILSGFVVTCDFTKIIALLLA